MFPEESLTVVKYPEAPHGGFESKSLVKYSCKNNSVFPGATELKLFETKVFPLDLWTDSLASKLSPEVSLSLTSQLFSGASPAVSLQFLLEEFFRKIFNLVNGFGFFIKIAFKLLVFIFLFFIFILVIFLIYTRNYLIISIITGIILLAEIAHYVRKSREKTMIKRRVHEKNIGQKIRIKQALSNVKSKNKNLLNSGKTQNINLLGLNKQKNKELLKGKSITAKNVK